MDELATNILAEQTPKQMILIQTKISYLLSNGIPPQIILKKFVRFIFSKIGSSSSTDEVKHKIIRQAANYQHLMLQGSREIFYLEAFVSGVMNDYQKYLQDLFA